jgi:two-component system sensor histidine kinase VicK
MLYQGEAAAHFIFVIVYTVISFVLLGCVLYFFIRQDVVLPLREIIDVMNRATDGETDVKTKPYPKNEIGMLAWSFNRMMSRFEHLTYSRNFIAHIILDITDGIIIMDRAKTVVAINKAGKKFLELAEHRCYEGMKLDHLRCSPLFAELKCLGEIDAVDVCQKEVKLLAGEDLYNIEMEVRVIKYKHDNAAYVIRMKDVTRQRRVDNYKNDLIATVTHEFKNPLASMHEMMSLMLEKLTGPLTVKQEELLSSSLKNIKRLNNLVENMLDFSKLEAGRMKFVREKTDVLRLIKEVVSLYDTLVSKRDIQLRTEVPKTIPDIYADYDKVQQVLINLVGNAVKFTDRGGVITVAAAEIKSAAAQQKPDMVQVSVKDTGRGIPADEMGKLFGKYQRVGENDAGPKGTGLGLYISKSIVDAHGGSMHVESRFHEGSSFSFTMPIYTERQHHAGE